MSLLGEKEKTADPRRSAAEGYTLVAIAVTRNYVRLAVDLE